MPARGRPGGAACCGAVRIVFESSRRIPDALRTEAVRDGFLTPVTACTTPKTLVSVDTATLTASLVLYRSPATLETSSVLAPPASTKRARRR
jgi:hypothetical protein